MHQLLVLLEHTGRSVELQELKRKYPRLERRRPAERVDELALKPLPDPQFEVRAEDFPELPGSKPSKHASVSARATPPGSPAQQLSGVYSLRTQMPSDYSPSSHTPASIQTSPASFLAVRSSSRLASLISPAAPLSTPQSSSSLSDSSSFSSAPGLGASGVAGAVRTPPSTPQFGMPFPSARSGALSSSTPSPPASAGNSRWSGHPVASGRGDGRPPRGPRRGGGSFHDRSAREHS